MVLVKIYGYKPILDGSRSRISEAIHAAVTEALERPDIRRNHRFFPLESYDFLYPEDKSKSYLMLELFMLEGYSIEARNRLIRLLYQNLDRQAAIRARDIEILINEIPKQNWSGQGDSGEEAAMICKL